MPNTTFRFGLLGRVALAILLGIGAGFCLPLWAVRIFATFNGLFSEFLGFMIPLIIVGLVTPAIADLGKGAGRMLLLTVALAYGSTLVAGLFSYGVSITAFPSLVHRATADLDAATAAATPAAYFSLTIPPLMNVMTALVLSFTFGIAMAYTHSPTLYAFCNEVKTLIERAISHVIIPLLPLYIFGIFLSMTATGQVAPVLHTFAGIILVIFAMHLVWLLGLYLIGGIAAQKSPIRLLRNMLPAYFTALGTQSSAATIPVTLCQTLHNGVSESVAGFVVPLCATIHLSGSMLKIVACAVALMMMQGMPIDFQPFLGFICMLGVTMVAAPGVPGGAIMAALGVLASMLGFGETEQALMIALYIAMDSFGTACNVTGDGAIALVVERLVHNTPASQTDSSA